MSGVACHHRFCLCYCGQATSLAGVVSSKATLDHNPNATTTQRAAESAEANESADHDYEVVRGSACTCAFVYVFSIVEVPFPLLHAFRDEMRDSVSLQHRMNAATEASALCRSARRRCWLPHLTQAVSTVVRGLTAA